MNQNNEEHNSLPLTRLWNVLQTAKVMGLSKYTLYEWVSQRRIPFVKIGRRLMFKPDDIDEFIGNNRFHPETRN